MTRYYLITSYSTDFRSAYNVLCGSLKAAQSIMEQPEPKDGTPWMLTWMDVDHTQLPKEKLTPDLAHRLCDTGTVPWGMVRKDGTHEATPDPSVSREEVEAMKEAGIEVMVIEDAIN